MIHLYHGSTVSIDHIDLQKSRPNKDFGRGFYLSADREQAWRMGEFKALTEGGKPVMNEYLFDEALLASDELQVLTFDGYSRQWAEFIFLNRNNKSDLPAHDYDISMDQLPMIVLGFKLENMRLATSPSTSFSII